MKKNSTKERLFEVTARLDKTFIPKLNEEVLPTEDKRITTSYQTVTPESAEQGDFADQGWENEEGPTSHTPWRFARRWHNARDKSCACRVRRLFLQSLRR